MLQGILNFVHKERMEFKRDPVRLRAAIIIPVVQLILLGYAANLDVRFIPMIVLDQDNSSWSRRLTDQFTSSGYFTIKQFANDPTAIDRALEHGEAIFALIIPHGFARHLNRGEPAPLQALVDGTDAAFSARSVNYASMIVQRFSRKIILQQTVRSGKPLPVAEVVPRTRTWFNPELESRWFLLPGILALILMIITMVGTAVSIVREKELGTMEQLMVTPIRPYEIILGKLIPSAYLGMLDVILVLLLVRYLFQIPIAGSFLLLLALTGLFLLTTLGLGLLISTVSHTQQQAMMTSVFFVMLPMLILSGFVFPIQNMPVPIQWLTYLLPLRYYFTIIRGIFLKGSGLPVLWDEALALLIIGLTVLTLSILRFRKRLA